MIGCGDLDDRWKDYVDKGTNRRRLEELVDEILEANK